MDPSKKHKENFHLLSDLFYIEPILLAESRLCIPLGPIRYDTLKANRDLQIAGHLGVQRTSDNAITGASRPMYDPVRNILLEKPKNNVKKGSWNPSQHPPLLIGWA